jgi:hypothetical protein
MSDEIERRLRAARHRLPAPGPNDTAAARAGFLEAAPRLDRRSRRLALLALAAAIAVAGAFGGGYALAGGGGATSDETHVVKTREARLQAQLYLELARLHAERARLNAGPGFLPADGWSIRVALDPRTGTVLAATATSVNGTRIAATFLPMSSVHGPAEATRTLPLRLPPGGRTRHLLARVAAYSISVTVTFPSARPSGPQLVAAREELGRLVVPSCPAALPLTAADPTAAKRYVLRWLPSHYAGDPSEVAGARAVAAAGRSAPRYGQAARGCGVPVAARSVEVDVTLPKLAKVGASLSQLTYFVAKTQEGWTVWERAR